MKQAIAAFAVSVGLAAAPAFAGQQQDKQPPKKPPTQLVKMSEAQLDNVTAGALLNLLVLDVVDVRNVSVDVAVPVNAAVAANVLGQNAGAAATQAGRILQ